MQSREMAESTDLRLLYTASRLCPRGCPLPLHLVGTTAASSLAPILRPSFPPSLTPQIDYVTRTCFPTSTESLIFSQSFTISVSIISYNAPCKPLQLHLQPFFFLLLLFRAEPAEPAAYGSSQAAGGIGATAASLHRSHSKAGSKLCLRPTPQLIATLDP